MAKKKTDGPENIADKLIEEFGKDIVRSAQDIIDNPRKIFSVSPSIDIGLGGGIP